MDDALLNHDTGAGAQAIRPGDILLEKSFAKEDGKRDIEVIFLVLSRHMESIPNGEGSARAGFERTIYYKTFLLYVIPTYSEDNFQVNRTYYLSEHEITDLRLWQRIYKSDLTWKDSYPRT